MHKVTVEQALAQELAYRGEALLSLPESQWFERKSARVRPRKVADALIGFANAEGGVLVVGLFDGRVEGIDSVGPKHLAALQQAAMDFTQPAVRCRTRLVECRSTEGRGSSIHVSRVTSPDSPATRGSRECARTFASDRSSGRASAASSRRWNWPGSWSLATRKRRAACGSCCRVGPRTGASSGVSILEPARSCAA